MMSWWRLLVAAAVVLLPLAFSQDAPPTTSPPATPPPAIDIAISNLDLKDAYYIRASCESSPRQNGRNVLAIPRAPEQDKCDVIMHTRKRGENLFVEIDIKHLSEIAGSSKLKPTEPVKIVQGTFSIECKSDQTVSCGVGDIKCEPKVVYFTEDRLYCSFIMRPKTKFTQFFESNREIPKLEYHSVNKIEILEYTFPKAVLWTVGLVDRCDPDFATTIDATLEVEGSHQDKPAERTETTVTCPFGGRLYINSGTDRYVDSITCGSAGDVWMFKAGNYTTNLESEFEAVCRTHYCSQCTASTLVVPSCPSCTPPVPNPPEDGKCSTITCTPNLWILDGEWMQNPIIECDGTNPRNPKWKVKKTENGRSIEVTKGTCTAEYNCVIMSELQFECEGDCDLPTYGADNKTLSCPEGYRIGVNGAGTIVANNYTCDTATGLFTTEGESIPAYSSIGCYDSRTPPPAPVKEDFPWLPVVLSGVIVVIAVPLQVAFHLYLKRNLKRAMDADAAAAADAADAAARKAMTGKKKKKVARIGKSGQQMRMSKVKVYKRRSKSNRSSGSGGSGGSKETKSSNKTTTSNISGKSQKKVTEERKGYFYGPRKVNPKLVPILDGEAKAYSGPHRLEEELDQFENIVGERIKELYLQHKAKERGSKGAGTALEKKKA